MKLSTVPANRQGPMRDLRGGVKLFSVSRAV